MQVFSRKLQELQTPEEAAVQELIDNDDGELEDRAVEELKKDPNVQARAVAELKKEQEESETETWLHFGHTFFLNESFHTQM